MSGPWDDFQAGGTATAEPEPTPAKAAPAAGPWTDFQPAATEAASSPPDGGKPWADFQAPKPTSALKQLFPSLMDLSPEQQQQVDTVKGAWNQAQAAGVSVQDMAKHAQAVSDQWDDVLDEVRQNRPDQLANFQAQRDEAMRQAGVEPFHLEAPVQLPKLSEGDVHTLFPGAGPRAVNAIQSGQNMVAGTAEGFTSVEGQAMFLPGIGPAIGKAFMGQMALSVPEQLGQAAGHYAAGDTQSGDSALIQAGSTAAMLGMPLLAEKVAEKLARKPETVQTPGRPQEDWLPKPEASPEIKPWEDAAAAATGQTAEGGGAKMEGGNGPAAAVPPPAPGVEAAAKPPEPAEPAALPSRLVTQALMDMTGKREPVPVSVLTAAGVAPEALAEGYTLNADGTAYEFTPPAVKLTPEQEMARANVQAMAELRAAKAAAGGEAAEDGGSKIEEETKTEPAAAGAAEPMPVDVTPAEVKAAGAGARTEAAPDLLDVVGDHYPNGVKFDADDHGEIVRSSRGAAADQMFLTKGEPADQVLKGLHEAGLYPRLESADDLALAMRAAGEARLGQRAPDNAAAMELAQQQKRTQMFQESALKPRAEAEATPAQQLFPGDTFKVNGQPVRVTAQVLDAETGKPSHVEVDGRYGKQTIPADGMVHLDRGSLRPAFEPGNHLTPEQFQPKIQEAINEKHARNTPSNSPAPGWGLDDIRRRTQSAFASLRQQAQEVFAGASHDPGASASALGRRLQNLARTYGATVGFFKGDAHAPNGVIHEGTILLKSNRSTAATLRTFEHELTHHLQRLGSPILRHLEQAVDLTTAAARTFRAKYDEYLTQHGQAALDDATARREIVAAHVAGQRPYGLNIAEAFRDPQMAVNLARAYHGAKPIATEPTEGGAPQFSPPNQDAPERQIEVVPPKAEIRKPIVGPTGAKIVGYRWKSKLGEKYSAREGGMVEARVSDWDNRETSQGTGRDIVHTFYVQHPNGRTSIEGIRSAQNILGISETKLTTIAKNEQAAQAHREQQRKLELEMVEKAARPTAAEAAQEYRKQSYSPMRSFEENNALFNQSRLLTKDGKFIRRSEAGAKLLLQNGWSPVETAGRSYGLGTPESEFNLLARLENLKLDTKGQLHAFGLAPAVWNTLIDGIKLAVRGGAKLADAIATALDQLKAAGHKFDDEGARAHLEATLGVRQFGEQVQDATDISDALKGKVTNTLYTRRPQEDDQAFAQRIVQTVGGPDQARAVFSDQTNALPHPVRMAVGMQILKSLDAAGRHMDAANFFDHDLAPHTTDVAQGLAMLNAWHAMSKDGKLNWAQLKILRSAKDATDPVRPDIEAAKTELQRQNAAGIEGTTADPAVQASAKEAITDAVANSPETHKGIIMELTQPWASSQFILDTARQHVNAKANELLNKAPMPIGFTPSQYLRSIMDDLAKRAAGIAAGHYQGAEPGVILRDKLQQRLGLSPDAASRLANALDKEFARQVKAAQDALPKRLARKVAQPERQKNTAAASRAEREGRARQARSIPDHEAEAAAQRLMETATSAGKDKPALQEFYQRLTTSLRRLLPEGTPGNGAKLTDIQRIAEAFANPEHFEEVWQRLGTELRAKYGIEGMADVQTTLGKLTPEALVETQLDRSMRAQMATMKVNLGQLVREHWTKVDATGAELADKLVQQAGLGREASAKLAEVIQRRFEALTARAKTAALDKLLQPVKKLGLAKPQMVEKLVKLSYLGAFDDGKFWNAIKERMNLPEWTNKLRDQLNALADKIGRIPADRIEDLQRAQTEFLNTIERAKGVSNLELGRAFYMQNILSGLTTHVRVAIHTSAQMMAATTAETGRALVEGRVSDIPLIYEALARGAGRALTQQKDIFRSGLVVGSKLQKVVPLSVLEQIHFGREGGTTVKQGPIARALLENRAASLLNLWKYNSRLITAQHMLYFAPAEEMKVALLAARQARTEGLTGRAAVDRARQMLGYGAAQVRAAEAQAIREGLEGTRAKMRVAEILKSSLPTAMKETARDYALRQTFLNEPYGLAGAIANLVITAQQSQHPVLSTAARVIVPFTRIAANLFNEGLNYTPIGAARARLAKTELMGEKFADITPEVRTDLQRELYAKSALGTMLLTGIALKAAQGLSQPNPGFTVYGAGPSNPQDKSAWRAAGGIPYSAKVGGRYVSYANTPGNVMLAALGNYLDGARDAALYQRPGAKRLAEDLPMRAVAATMGAGKVILEQPFLQSLVELANMAGENNPEISARGAVKTAARTGSSFVVPNLLRQVDRFYDPTAYDQKTLSGILTSQVPFVRQSGRPMLNALGQPIQSPVFGMFTGPATADPLVQTLTQHNAWPALPNRNQVTVNGVPLSDDEFYLYAKTRGQALADLLSRPSVKTMLDTLATQSDRLNAQAAAAANPVAKARLQAAASSLQSKVMGKYTAVADKLADAAVIRTRGY